MASVEHFSFYPFPASRLARQRYMLKVAAVEGDCLYVCMLVSFVVT